MSETVLMLNVPLVTAIVGGALLFVIGIKLGTFIKNRETGGGKFTTLQIPPNKK